MLQKDCTINDLKKKTEFKRLVNVFCVDINPIDNSNIIDIHKYLMEKT